MSKPRNIAIVWDFDGTLTPHDSTSELINNHFKVDKDAFWDQIHNINGVESGITWERLLASDTPTWMFVLSQTAYKLKQDLNESFFKADKIKNIVKLYDGVEEVLESLKNLSKKDDFQTKNIIISHFIISVGLKEYIAELVPKHLFSGIWGSRYRAIKIEGEERVQSIPVFCMDETMKTRAIFEICKGVFQTDKPVNKRIEKKDLWCPFENLIYIGDGDTDIPALALTKERGGYGIVVYNANKSEEDIKKKLKNMSIDRRCDLITKAEFNLHSKLYRSIEARCYQILQRYEAEDFCSNSNVNSYDLI